MPCKSESSSLWPHQRVRRAWLGRLARGLGLLALPGSVAALLAGSSGAGRAQSAEFGTVLKLTARKSVFTPNELRVKAGDSVVIEVDSQDFAHGFNVPDLHFRVDLAPDSRNRIELKFETPGNYVFFCDNFCGDDHEDMFGKFIVTA